LLWLYNHHIPQKALDHRTPIQVLQHWQQQQPALFLKRAANHPGPDAYTDCLALLIADEIARREQKKLNLRLRRANFRSHKTLEQFDFGFNPGINRALIQELATGRFITEPVSVLIAGPCATGKSHLAQALGHTGVRLGHDVLFTTQTQLLGSLNAARATATFERRFQALARVSLLIIDDFGLA
jgi:DNA replication protein DnaC